MVIEVSSRNVLHDPVITLNGVQFEGVSQFKYLGHIGIGYLGTMLILNVNEGSSGQGQHTGTQIGSSRDVKITLFGAYYKTLYTSNL